MARLYDYIVAGRLGDHRHAVDPVALRQVSADRLAGVPVIVLDNVAQYFYASDPKDVWSLSADFPNIAPPLDEVWVEFYSGGVVNRGGQLAEMKRCHAGWHMRSRRYGEGWGVRSTLYASLDGHIGHPQGPILDAIYQVDHGGGYKALHHDRGLAVEVPYGSALTEREREDLALTATHLIKPVFLGLSFMHCKNVERSEVTPSAIERHPWKKKHGRPLVRYEVLDIDPMKKTLESEGGASTNGLKKALHICRGHFATYTEDAPLFGKITGTFWKPQHVRGSAKSGAVVKDYNVKGP